jgi:pyridoxal phosphate enzyme (YggS family)
MSTDIAHNLKTINDRISNYEFKYNRPPHSVTLLAVSKKQSVEKIRVAIQAGQRLFGENYLQEALPKIDALKNDDIIWYFIGPIQRNKTKKIAEHFTWVLSVDDELIAKRLNDQRPQTLPPLNICLQINISEEETKSGLSAHHAIACARFCKSLPNIRLRGLMAIPAPTSDFNKAREIHHQLFLLWNKMRIEFPTFDTLSIGMSDDYEAAIAEGSTLIRIGTAIFGSR